MRYYNSPLFYLAMTCLVMVPFGGLNLMWFFWSGMGLLAADLVIRKLVGRLLPDRQSKWIILSLQGVLFAVCFGIWWWLATRW